MSEKKFGKRFLAWALTMVLTVSLLPLSALAEEVDSDEYEADSYDLEQPDGGIQTNAEKSESGKTITISKGKTDHCTAYYIEGPDGLEQFLDKDLEDLPDLPVFSASISHSNVTGNYGVLFFVKPDDGYALTKINGQGNTFNSIVDNEEIEKCDFWKNGNRGNLRIAGFNDALIRVLVQKAKDAGCVAAFLYTRAASAGGFSTALDFQTEPLATLEKSVYAINGSPYNGGAKVKAGDKITYALTVNYHPSASMPVTYSNVVVQDEREVQPSATIEFVPDGSDSQTEYVTYTVRESDLTGEDLTNTATLTYNYQATFNNSVRTSTDTANAGIATISVVSYEYQGEIPSSAAEIPEAKHYAENDIVTVEKSPDEVPGYTFGGWTASNVKHDANDKFRMPDEHVKFIGTWTADRHQVTYQITGEDSTYRTFENVAVGSQNSVLAVPVKEGYTFSGWTTENAMVADGKFTMPAGDVLFTGHWTVNQYNVTYVDGVDGAAFENQKHSADYGTATPAFDGEPTREGYTFMNWTPAVATTVTGDVTYTAQWQLNDTPVTPEPPAGPETPDNGGSDNGGSEAPTTPTTPSRPSRPSRPSSSTDNTVTIEDDDALGLNTTDHFAYIVGYGNGEVRPQNNITRAEVATIFFRLLTDDVRDENLTKTNRYSDVAATSWYNTAVSTMTKAGIVDGYPDGTFRPNAAITRAEFAAIAARFDNDGDKTAAKFSDIATHWAKDEISIAYNNGWITGYPDGTFGPQRDITRAETMTLVNRVLNRQPETEDDLLPNMTVWTDNANPKAWYYLAVQEATNSHYYEFKTNSQYEKWTELRETREWQAPEQ